MSPSRLAFALTTALALAGCRGEPRKQPDSKPSEGPTRPARHVEASAALEVVKVPSAKGPFKLEGELDEPEWALSGRTGPFTRGGASGAADEVRPFSDARFLWGDGQLYLGLYAADDDLRSAVTKHDGPVWLDDTFSIAITEDRPGAPTFLVDVSVGGVVTDAKVMAGAAPDATWESGLKLGVDRDGTLNDAHDEDEEWVVEAALPLASMGIAPKAGTRFRLEIRRCDTPRGSKRSCGKAVRILELSP